MRRLALATAVGLVLLGGAAAPHGTSGDGGLPAAQAEIVTVAGNGVDGFDGDGGPAVAASINHPRGIAVLADGSFVFAQPFLPMVRRVTPEGIITRVVGNGAPGYSGDGIPGTSAQLSLAHGVAAMPDGGFVIADMGNNRIRRVWPNGIITTVVGVGERGFSGDGGPAAAAAIALPRGIAARPNGELLIPDTGNARIRRVAPDGTISTVAGTGVVGFAGDGGPATAAQLNRPFSVAPLPDGGFLIADLDNDRIRKVDKRGIITTVAGTGQQTYSGDGGPATQAAIYQPHAVAALPDGGFLIADTYNHRVRRVWPDGRITTVAGTGVAGFGGDGGRPTEAALNLPKALAVLPDLSGFLVGDAGNNRIRLVRMGLRPALRLRVGVRRLQAYAGRSLWLRYTLSEAARVQLDVMRRRSVISSIRVPGRRGGNRVRIGPSLAVGTYSLRLTAFTADGRKAVATTSLTIRPRPAG